MPPRSPFDYDVSVTADKARRARRRGMSGAVNGAERLCDHPNCDRAGLYRAPYAPSDLNRYRWFCLDHIRDYNKSWDFFAEHSPEEIEARQRAAHLWERPTWRLGERPPGTHAHIDGRAWERFGFADPADVLGENATLNPGRAKGASTVRRSLPKNIRNALEILSAGETETRDAIRQRYRALVKQLHPDMNGGDRSEEGRLRRVLWAWEQIKASRLFPK